VALGTKKNSEFTRNGHQPWQGADGWDEIRVIVKPFEIRILGAS
jgi:hypothetical protein